MVVGMEMIAMGVISGRLKDELFQYVFLQKRRIFILQIWQDLRQQSVNKLRSSSYLYRKNELIS